jgi:hypothetical protein
MKMEHEEPVIGNPNATLRLGIASWDEGDNTMKSIKYAWRDKNGRVCRGGEVPIESLEQMMDFAKKHGYIGENPIVFVGEAAFLEDFAAFLNSENVAAKVEYIIRASEPKDTLGFLTKGKRATSNLLKVTSSIIDLAKKIVDYLASKKKGSIKFSTGAKTIVITKKDSEGNIIKYFEENKGTYFDIDFEA